MCHHLRYKTIANNAPFDLAGFQECAARLKEHGHYYEGESSGKEVETIYTYIHTYLRTYLRTYIHTRTHTYMHACMHAWMDGCM